MSQENVEVVIAYFEAPEMATAIDALADDVTFAFHGRGRHLAGAHVVSGKDKAVKWLADWFSRFDSDYRMSVEETRDLGDRVLVVTHHRATGRISGVPISERTAQVMTLRHGRITRQDFYANREEALEAAGLPE